MAAVGTTMTFNWWTGPQERKSWGVHYGNHKWPSWSDWFVPGTWPGAWEDH